MYVVILLKDGQRTELERRYMCVEGVQKKYPTSTVIAVGYVVYVIG